MTAKEFLSRYRTLNAEINAKLEEAAQIRALAERVTPSDRGGGNGNVSDRVGRGAARLADLEREIDREIDRLVELRAEIEAAIAKVEDERYRVILTERYLNGKRWKEVSQSMNYGYDSIRHIHRKALDCLEKIYHFYESEHTKTH